MSTKTIAAEKRCETVIENLRELTRDDDDELMDQGFRLTVEASMLRLMLLSSGGQVYTRGIKYDLKREPLGLGVYNVWLRKASRQ